MERFVYSLGRIAVFLSGGLSLAIVGFGVLEAEVQNVQWWWCWFALLV